MSRLSKSENFHPNPNEFSTVSCSRGEKEWLIGSPKRTPIPFFSGVLGSKGILFWWQSFSLVYYMYTTTEMHKIEIVVD
jgi:hypothetical protein